MFRFFVCLDKPPPIPLSLLQTPCSSNYKKYNNNVDQRKGTNNETSRSQAYTNRTKIYSMGFSQFLNIPSSSSTSGIN